MSRFLCVAVVLSASLLTGAAPAFAGMSEGVAAATTGDYERAISEFRPLADAGEPAAQYHLAKIYLEGRGPADGVPQGIALMNKAASGGYPEAQAQLGLMYAMGLGVEPDNVKAYDWLTQAVNALPAGMRRTVAEANRDAVLKRMSASEKALAVAQATKPAETKVAAEKPATGTTGAKTATSATATTKAASATAATNTAATTTAATTTAATTPAATTKTTAKTGALAPAATTTKTVTEAAATNKTATAAAKATKANPVAEATAPAKSTPEKSTQVASAKAPEAESGTAPKADGQKAASGVRIQLASMPSEEAAWSAWKQISGKYAGQLSGLTAIVEPADLGDKGTFYRVQTGPFQTVAAAQERCTAMKAAGLDCLVVGKP